RTFKRGPVPARAPDQEPRAARHPDAEAARWGGYARELAPASTALAAPADRDPELPRAVLVVVQQPVVIPLPVLNAARSNPCLRSDRRSRSSQGVEPRALCLRHDHLSAGGGTRHQWDPELRSGQLAWRAHDLRVRQHCAADTGVS